MEDCKQEVPASPVSSPEVCGSAILLLLSYVNPPKGGSFFVKRRQNYFETSHHYIRDVNEDDLEVYHSAGSSRVRVHLTQRHPGDSGTDRLQRRAHAAQVPFDTVNNLQEGHSPNRQPQNKSVPYHNLSGANLFRPSPPRLFTYNTAIQPPARGLLCISAALKGTRGESFNMGDLKRRNSPSSSSAFSFWLRFRRAEHLKLGGFTKRGARVDLEARPTFAPKILELELSA
ncbi:hypothetical protein B0H19DRAFT_1234099 [Mycena capillaripes]|nr:hypothetical protein B0H19DRAFT_1234099 [Mycena capillaripes]